MRKFVLDPQKLPISFIMGDKAYSGMPGGCTIEQNGMNITYTSVIDNVEVRAECVAYDDFDASEWTVYFTNKGSEKSPIFRAVNGINTVFEGENHKIYTGNGDYCVADGYSEAQTVLSYGYNISGAGRHDIDLLLQRKDSLLQGNSFVFRWSILECCKDY